MIPDKFFLAAVFAVVAGAGMASGGSRDPGALLDAVVACDGIPAPLARLACFDAHVAELKAARLQDVRLFQPPRAQDRPPFAELRSTIASVTPLQTGTWLLVLADRSVWQTDDVVRFEPERGDAVRIARGPLGGFVANIGGQRAIRLRSLH